MRAMTKGESEGRAFRAKVMMGVGVMVGVVVSGGQLEGGEGGQTAGGWLGR